MNWHTIKFERVVGKEQEIIENKKGDVGNMRGKEGKYRQRGRRQIAVNVRKRGTEKTKSQFVKQKKNENNREGNIK